MICRIFGERSVSDKDYLPEYEAAKSINAIIRDVAEPQLSDFLAINKILKEVDNVLHADGSAWFDYKLHVGATLRINGFK